MDPNSKLSTDYATQCSAKEKCEQWVESSEFSTTSDDLSSISGRSTEFVSSVEDNDASSIADDIANIDLNSANRGDKLKVVSSQSNISEFRHTEILQNVFKGNNTQTFKNIQVQNSNKVHIGNVTYVTGPIHIIQTNGNSSSPIQQSIINSTQSTSHHPREGQMKVKPSEVGIEKEERNRDDIFLSNVSKNIDTTVLRMVNRRTWLAQPALDHQALETPVPYVVISHTATESADTQADMVYMVRNIQCFHIESRRWNDIAYNFLVGNDGNVYEGRSWTGLGAHTYGYNTRSIGISFVGCYMNELPARVALEACKLLIERGVQEGYIQPDYKLVAHCQCSATESPGRMLFEEIKKWPHWTSEP
ncbi:peptidoglycan-recognition protein LE-like [Toxorhynchites rutilus septentrionalis]|uniref:peptidoglycan-recognition protein LE-like n=1 Tax=Toxorhynchites rutilus septentrionalis TaxID=329112 RepID=UPI00247A3617|nr:peptidoglycan-recognition protein LE-like [Toxorhynchites rutilus septentrionalis]XP_055625012.1 peptidoglycan-recognition protein LE-like [Toxorhynchites rutilus septentrionalis]XP_055625020.1 peptidoglycan-recognition protein LE-like [Toxorhynchites rutilus septentrionalis]